VGGEEIKEREGKEIGWALQREARRGGRQESRGGDDLGREKFECEGGGCGMNETGEGVGNKGCT